MTQYSVIYDRAIFKIKSQRLLGMSLIDRTAVLLHFLQSAIVDFADSCKYDLTNRSDTNGYFNIDLGEKEIEILSYGVAYYWAMGQTLDEKNMKNVMSPKDYTKYSPANLLKELENIRQNLKREFLGRINTYSYVDGSFRAINSDGNGGAE